MQKRGQLLYKFGSELLVAAVIVLIFLGISYGYANGEAIAKIRAAKDIALMIEEMYALPNEVSAFVEYPENVSRFTISVENNVVRAFTQSSDTTESSYAYAGSGFHEPLSIMIKKPNQLFIGKINGKIIITDKKPDLRKLPCPNQHEITVNSILIDSGIEEGNAEKAKIANAIAFSLIQKLGGYQVEHARNDDISTLASSPLSSITTRLEKKIESADLIIKIKIGESHDKSNNIKAYFSPLSQKNEQAGELACNMLNSIIENEDFSQITAIQVVPKDTMDILNNDKISLVLEIGNYLNPEFIDIVKNPGNIEAISSAISNAIE